MNEARPHPRYTYAQYVAIEMSSEMKHEFLDGEIWIMAGRSEDHSKLATNTAGLLHRVVEEPCFVHGSDLRIYVEEVHAREGDDTWSTRAAMRGGTVELSSIAVRLNVDEIYRGTTISAD